MVAPPVIEFDDQGAVVQAWGGSGTGYEWPATEHGLAIDAKLNVWVSGSAAGDTQLVKFSRTGKFLLQIGRAGQKGSNADTANVSRAADMRVNAKTGELYVADGEGGNRRVIVFDGETGAYKRHWGAYGEKPNDEPAPKYDPAATSRVFSNAVHCVAIAKDGLVYVCDRGGDRIQVFRQDGTFVKEAFVARETLGAGSTSAIGFSPDQRFLYVADGTNGKLWILQRDTLEIVGSVGAPGPQAGQFQNVHGLAADSKGNVYTAEVGAARVQKFVPGPAR